MRKQRASEEGESFRKRGHRSSPVPNRKALSALVEKYNAEIEKLMKEIEPQRQQWEKDKKAMLNAHRGEGKNRDEKPHRGKPGMKKARFLLLDVSMVPKIQDNIRN